MAGNSLGAQMERMAEQESGAATSGPSTDGLRQSTLTSLAKEGGKAYAQTQFNFAVMRLFTSCHLPANILDRKVWKNLVSAANPRLDTFSSTTLHDVHIAQEAARSRKMSIDTLRCLENLTLSFDGGTTESRQSVYTLHVTTPDTRDSHFLVGDESSGMSHTADYICELAIGVMKEIGPYRFVAVVSDSTGSTKGAREKAESIIKTILAMADAAHPLNNLIKAICSLGHFVLVSGCCCNHCMLMVCSRLYLTPASFSAL